MEILGNDSLDTVWIEATPVIGFRDNDDGGRVVPEAVSKFQSLRVSGDIPLHELNVQIIQNLLRDPARLAVRGRDDSDQ